MIGDVEFNSSTYYKYLNVFWEGLVDNLGQDKETARKAVLALLQAAVLSPAKAKHICSTQSSRPCPGRNIIQEHSGHLCQRLYQAGQIDLREIHHGCIG